LHVIGEVGRKPQTRELTRFCRTSVFSTNSTAGRTEEAQNPCSRPAAHRCSTGRQRAGRFTHAKDRMESRRRSASCNLLSSWRVSQGFSARWLRWLEPN